MTKTWLVLPALILALAAGRAQGQKKTTPVSGGGTSKSASAKDVKGAGPITAAGLKLAKSKMTQLNTPSQKASYAIGADIAKNLKTQGISIDLDALNAGMRDVTAGKTLAMTDKEMQDAFQAIQSEVNKKSESKSSVEGDKNLAAGQAFLAENAKKPGIHVLPSGLQYEIMKEGTGPKPADTSTVTTHYHGTLIDGTVFDSSVERGQPASFPVNGVIKGWQEALPLMPVGSKWKLFVPSELAYGNRGAGAKIGP